jgi:hypothetical protein
MPGCEDSMPVPMGWVGKGNVLHSNRVGLFFKGKNQGSRFTLVKGKQGKASEEKRI